MQVHEVIIVTEIAVLVAAAGSHSIPWTLVRTTERNLHKMALTKSVVDSLPQQLSSRLQQRSAVSPHWHAARAGMPPKRVVSHGKPFAMRSFVETGFAVSYNKAHRRHRHTLDTGMDDSFFKSSDPRLAIARVVSVRSWLICS